MVGNYAGPLRTTRFIAFVLVTAVLGLLAQASPAHATDNTVVGTAVTRSQLVQQMGVSPNTTAATNHVRFNVKVNGRWECLDAANGHSGSGSSAPQADVWGCQAKGELSWDFVWDSTGTYFYLYNRTADGCLDNWGAVLSDGNPIKMWGPTATDVCATNPSEKWRLYTVPGGTTYWLAPNSYGGTIHTGAMVASISGTPKDGSLLHMWHLNASSDQFVYLGDN
jgi:hypothetical protein